jgi:hypothetical protein
VLLSVVQVLSAKLTRLIQVTNCDGPMAEMTMVMDITSQDKEWTLII